MTDTLTTKRTDLEDSRVRVEVEVDPGSVDSAVSEAATALGHDLKLPGFRKGKVPAPVVLQRMGRESVLDDAIRRSLPGWYAQAVSDAGIVTIGDPQLDLSEVPEKGAALAFSFEVAVRPEATLGDYKGLEVGRREPAVDSTVVDGELERMRESMAKLETVERPAAEGDYVVIDFVGKVEGETFEGGDARGFVLELGSNRLIEGFEPQLEGASAGDSRVVEVSFPEEYRAEHLAGKAVTFDVDLKEVKEKVVPELDDDFAVGAGGFDSLAELRADLDSKVLDQDTQQVENEFREAAVDAAVAVSKVDVPHDLVHTKAHEMWGETAQRLAAQGLEPQRYLEMVGQSEEEFITEHEGDAERALARESVLAAILEAEQIDVSEEEVLDALRAAAAQSGAGQSDKAIRRALERAREAGREELLLEDIGMRKVVDLLVESAKPIPIEQAKARDELWTPDQDEPAKPKEIWTPDS
ncbi:MAG: trigger factor [Thermoleophilaceae bacterium]|nr:trigger factor [Thermoleophilaceae bacterium]